MSTGKSDRTRQLIIEKAAPFFNKKGYADTSMMDIVSATGLTKGAIYGNFENKDDLAIRVFEYNLGLIQKGVNTAISQQADAVAKLLAMTEYYRNEYRHLADRGGCPMLNAAMEADDNFPALKLKVRAGIRQWKKTIVQIIEEGKEHKTIQKKANAEQYATLIIAMIEGGVMLAKALDDNTQIYTMLNKIEEIIQRELAL